MSSQDSTTNKTKFSSFLKSDKPLKTNPITQTTVKTTSTQSLSFFDLSYLAHFTVFRKIFLPSNIFSTTPIFFTSK